MKSIRKFFSKSYLALCLMLVTAMTSTGAFAVAIDTTVATGQIGDNQTAAITVGMAIAGMIGVIVGVMLLISTMKRGK